MQRDVPVAGILTGISFVSGLDYYKGVNEGYAALVERGHLMKPNPPILMMSVDCDKYAHMLEGKDWQGVREYLCSYVGRLVAGGATFLTIASNTGHICVPEVRMKHPSLPILHIADCTAAAIKAQGITCVGLLGTAPTMREPYLKEQLAKHGIQTIVPESSEDQDQIFSYIMHELGFSIFKNETREFFKAQVHKLAASGAQGVILGCTEIELLIQQEHTPDVPLFASAELHIEAVSQVLAGHKTIAEFQPPADVRSRQHARKRHGMDDAGMLSAVGLVGQAVALGLVGTTLFG